MTPGLFLVVMALAFSCGVIDTSMGMGYGTIMAPVLILSRYHPKTVIPALLLSQAVGGLSASFFHQMFKNVSFTSKSKDLTIVFIITGWGILATIFGARVALNIPDRILNTYIGILIIAVGSLLIMPFKYNFSWIKLICVGILSAFNKGISGGGFGPVVTGGQVLSGHKEKRAVSVTTLAEVPICIAGFVAWTITQAKVTCGAMPSSGIAGEYHWGGLMRTVLHRDLTAALLFGVILAAPLGPYLTRTIKHRWWRYIIGSLIAVLGIWLIIKTFLPVMQDLPMLQGWI